jgi:hypothetical protein
MDYLSILALSGFVAAGCEPVHLVSGRPSSSAYLEEFSGVAALLLLVEKCEESEVSELRSGVTNAASHRKGYVSSRISLMPGSDWARWPN